MDWTAYQDMLRENREIAWAAATDAGNRSMHAAGRKRWNEDDWNAARAVLNELMDPRNIVSTD